jgi:dTDP-4-dehydrorhamnose 3,5-epimerase
LKIVSRPFSGVIVLEPQVFIDDRGFFLESFEVNRYRGLGIEEDFVQENHSRSSRNVLRGLHFTRKRPQAQILTVIHGHIFDVVVDLRSGSSSFGKWFGTELCDEGPRQIYMTHGFAHGFCVLSDHADLHYKTSQRYDASDNAGLRWDDPDVDIQWPAISPLVSGRDKSHPYLEHIKAL